MVYLREGHDQFLEETRDKRPPPWQLLPGGRSMRAAEPCRWAVWAVWFCAVPRVGAIFLHLRCPGSNPACFSVFAPRRVAAVDYVIADDGTDRTLARLTLSFSDAASPLKVRSGAACAKRKLLGCRAPISTLR